LNYKVQNNYSWFLDDFQKCLFASAHPWNKDIWRMSTINELGGFTPPSSGLGKTWGDCGVVFSGNMDLSELALSREPLLMFLNISQDFPLKKLGFYVNFSFWAWFFEIMTLIRRKLEWCLDEGLVRGFISRSMASELVLANPDQVSCCASAILSSVACQSASLRFWKKVTQFLLLKTYITYLYTKNTRLFFPFNNNINIVSYVLNLVHIHDFIVVLIFPPLVVFEIFPF